MCDQQIKFAKVWDFCHKPRLGCLPRTRWCRRGPVAYWSGCHHQGKENMGSIPGVLGFSFVVQYLMSIVESMRT